MGGSAVALSEWVRGSRASVSNDKLNRPSVTCSVHSPLNIRLDIQGLRAISVLAVMLYHANSGWLKSGFIGVDVFFVISGFIVTALLTERRGGVDLAAFYVSRVKRILPAYLCMLGVVSILAVVLLLPSDFLFFLNSLRSATFFISNQYFSGVGSYFAPVADELPLLHTWSLSIEMQFYLLFPVLILYLPAQWRFITFASLTVSLFSWVGYQAYREPAEAAYFSFLARAPEFTFGVVLALLLKQRELPLRVSGLAGAVGAALLAISAVLIDTHSFPGVWYLLPCIGAGLIIAAKRGPVSALLGTSPLVWLGHMSYSLYLWHWPVLALIRYYSGHYTLSVSWLFVFVASSFVLAWISFRFIETPTRQSVGGGYQVIKLGAAVMIIVTILGSGKWWNSLLVEPLPIELTRYADPKAICHGVQVGTCKRGDPNADIAALVIGDSHAAQLNYFFDRVGEIQGTGYRVLTASSCVPITGFDVERLPGWARKSCLAQIQTVRSELPKVDKLIIAGMWQYHMQSEIFVTAFAKFLSEAVKDHKRVVVLAQVPMFEMDIQRVRRFTAIGLPLPIHFDRDWQRANQEMKRLVDQAQGVRFLDFSKSSFFAAAPYHEGSLIYRDRHHLNEVGARRYGNYAAERLQRAFDQPQPNVSLKP